MNRNQLTTAPPKAEALAKVRSSMERLDAVASDAALLSAPGNPFSQAIVMASAIQDIRAALTDEVMTTAILPLMNSKLGFRTDKDPNRPTWNRQSRRMEAPEPYPIATVRECAIEAILRGLVLVGNTWNIIAGQSYVTKEGFWYLIRHKVAGLTDFKLSVGVPKMIKAAGDARNAQDEEAKGALVHCSASWRMNGVADSIEREIPIRVNAMMGADAIMGKAERKMLAAAYAQITGTTLGDADAAEAESDMRTVTPKAQTEPGGGVAAPVTVEPEVTDEAPRPSPEDEAPQPNVDELPEVDWDKENRGANGKGGLM